VLTTLGLDITAETVYRAMLARPHDGTAALAARLGIAEEQVMAALDVLSELSLVRPSHDREGELRAVAPEVGLEVLLARQQAALAAEQERLESSRAAAAQLIAEFADLHPASRHPRVEQLVGLDEIRDHIARLARTLRSEIMTFAPGGAQRPEDIEASKPHDTDLLSRGIRMRTVYLNSVRNSQHTLAYVYWLTELGGEVRTVPELPTRMIIFDRTAALIPVSSDDTAAGAVSLTGQGILVALCALFENVWARSQSLTQPATRNEAGLSTQEETVVSLLARGLTDAAIAQRLGVSQRTARRLANELMERLGARSRFEFGVRAAQQGWIPKR
jgi:DNA-binding CsgD family transcriptional regulator/sugar-specific transcriptional regulator TrmB